MVARAATPAERLVAACGARGWRIGVAESCTGGLAAASIVSVPGASAVFAGGVVAYADEVKMRALGVPADLLRGSGAVSREVAAAMAEGLRVRWGLDAAAATTGVAGPGGGTPAKPVGTVFVAVSSARGTEVEMHRFGGGRSSIRRQAAARAVGMLLTVAEGE